MILSRRFPISFLAWLLLTSACSSTFKVNSDPMQADVFVQDQTDNSKKPLGKTPLEMSMSLVKQTVGPEIMSGQYFALVIEKPGFATEKLMIPSTKFGTLVTSVDVKLKEGAAGKEVRVAKDLLDRLFVAQKFALARQYDRSLEELDKILAQVPDFPRALSMKGSVYYLQKKYPESLRWYEEAVKADPQMEEAIKMVTKVRSLAGGAGAASGASGASGAAGGKGP